MADDITSVRIGKNLVGLNGLKEIFEDLAPRSWESPAAAQEELLRRAAGANYVPPGSRDDYGRALWQEFRRFKGETTEAEGAPGLEIKVPAFIKVGDRVKIDTRTKEYLARV